MFVRGTAVAPAVAPAVVLRTINARLLRLQLPRPPAASSLYLYLKHRHLSTARKQVEPAETTRAAAVRASILADIPILGVSNPSGEKTTRKRKKAASLEIGASGVHKPNQSKKGKAGTDNKITSKLTSSAEVGTAGPKVKLKKVKTITTIKKKRTSTTFTSKVKVMSQQNQPIYAPYAIVTNFRRLPYKHRTLSRTDLLALAKYFDLEPFFTQSDPYRWEIYHDTDQSGKPVLLITLDQAWGFLDWVRQETGIEVPKHPKSLYCYKLKPDGTAPEPQRVATVGSKTQWEEVTAQWAGGTTGRGGTAGNAESSITAEEKEAKKRRQKEKQDMKRAGYSLQVEKARKLLRFNQEALEGSTVTASELITTEWGPNEGEQGGVRITTEGFERIEKPGASKGGEQFEDVPFFVCVDCESWEVNHSFITEIGISTLDMGALPPSSTRPTYESIDSLMKHRHIRVRENLRRKNGRYVPDAADRFDFGRTEIWGLSELPRVLSEAFTPPPLPSPSTDSNGRKKRRTIAFVGHDAATDIKYLVQCKFDSRAAVPETLARLDAEAGINSGKREMEVYDTADMYKSITGEMDTKGLGKMSSELGLNPWNLHNAGNDAAFTLKGFVKMCATLENGSGSATG